MEHNHRALQPEELLEILPQLLAEDTAVPLVITGDSMYPFLKHGRDTVYLSALTRPVRPGDMIFYRRPFGRCVLHRVISVQDNSYCLLGDHQISREWGVSPDSVMAIVTAVRRKGKLIQPGHPIWFFFEKIWPRLILLRPYLIKLYTFFDR